MSNSQIGGPNRGAMEGLQAAGGNYYPPNTSAEMPYMAQQSTDQMMRHAPMHPPQNQDYMYFKQQQLASESVSAQLQQPIYH